MKLSHIVAILFLIVAISLSACVATSTSEPAPEPTATTVSLLTEPQPTATLVPTFTSTPSPEPTATNTPLPTTTLPPAPELTSEPTATEPAASMIRVNDTLSTAVNVRSGPSTDYPVVAQFQPGQEAIVVGKNADDSWWQISLANAADGAEAVGWIYGQLVTFSGDNSTISLVEAPPPPPTATPAPVAAAEDAPPADQESSGTGEQPSAPAEAAGNVDCGKDFCVTYQAMVPIGENGGCIGNHSIYVTVLEGPPPGRPMDGVVVGDTFNNIEVASGDKGPGHAEVTLWMNSMSLKVKRHIDGTPYTSEESFSFTAHDELIPAEVLAANGYCDGSIEKCRVAQQNNQICRGHYSWRVTFHKFD